MRERQGNRKKCLHGEGSPQQKEAKPAKTSFDAITRRPADEAMAKTISASYAAAPGERVGEKDRRTENKGAL